MPLQADAAGAGTGARERTATGAAPRPDASAALRRRALVTAGYVLAAVVLTWPLAADLTGRLGAPHGPGDPWLNLWILGWDLRTLSEQPTAVLTGRVFDAPIFHPARQTLAYSDHLLLQAAAVWPVYAAGGGLTLCYNLVLLGSLIASALAMYACVRAVTASTPAAWIAGLLWGFWGYRFGHLIHLQLQALYFLPLAWWLLHRVFAGRRRRDAVLLGVFAALQAIASVYYGVIGAVGLAAGAIAVAAAVGRWRHAPTAGRLILAGAVGLVLVAPFVLPYWQVQQREGFTRNLFEASRHAASLTSYVTVWPGNLLYGRTGLLPADTGTERSLFPGFAAIALAAVGLRRARARGAWPVALAAAVVIGAGLILSLGPDGVRPLYAAMHRWVFGFQAIRAPARFGVLVTFGIALLAALGVREILIRARERGFPAPAVAAVLTGAVAIELLNAPIPLSAAPALHTPVGAWLASAPGPGAVLVLPLAGDAGNTPAMLQELEHGRPIVNGYSGQRPAFFTSLVDTFSTFPSADAMWTLKELDVRFVVSPRRIEGGQWPLVERAQLATADGRAAWIYELAWSEEAEAALGEPAGPAPPPPGPIPFAAGERAVYDAIWEGGGGTLSAGRITLAVDRGEGGEADGASWRFLVRAETAAWVSRFFEARDEFETWTDGALRPIRHERRLREGRRHIDRAAIFDWHAGVTRIVQTSGAEAGPAIRLSDGTRDPLSLFAYVRTLPLERGEPLRLPLVDMSRRYVIEIDAPRRETIEWQGRPIAVLRVEPRIVERVARRQPPRIVVWIAERTAWLPLRAEVSAAFGTIRLELVEHRPGGPPMSRVLYSAPPTPADGNLPADRD